MQHVATCITLAEGLGDGCLSTASEPLFDQIISFSLKKYDTILAITYEKELSSLQVLTASFEILDANVILIN